MEAKLPRPRLPLNPVDILCDGPLQPFARRAEVRPSPKRGPCRELTPSRPHANVMIMRLTNEVPALKTQSKFS